MPTILVTCPNGHRFPVNLEKHQNRDYRICPRRGCGERVKIRSRLSFTPNPDWLAKKEGYRNAQEKRRAQEEAQEKLNQFFSMLSRGRRHGRKPRKTAT